MWNHAHGSPFAPGPPPPPAMSGSKRLTNASVYRAEPLRCTSPQPTFCSQRAVIKKDDLPPGRNRMGQVRLAGKNVARGLSRFEPGKRPAHGCTIVVGEEKDRPGRLKPVRAAYNCPGLEARARRPPVGALRWAGTGARLYQRRGRARSKRQIDERPQGMAQASRPVRDRMCPRQVIHCPPQLAGSQQVLVTRAVTLNHNTAR
jgi:hypothetical protein